MNYINEYANPLLDLFIAEYASGGRTPTLDDLEIFIDDQVANNPDEFKRLLPNGNVSQSPIQQA